MTTTANHRRDARIDVRVPVVLIRGKASFELETLDVSFRGCFVKCDSPPALRSLVRMRLALPHRALDVHAMAVHVVAAADGREGGVGLQFWGLSGTDRQVWEEFIRALATLRNEPSGIRRVAGALGDAPPFPPRTQTKK
jgi:hypothetical protein